MITHELTDWQLWANYPYVPELTNAAETGQALSPLFAPIPARVPGCVHNDLLAAGKIPDPYYEANSLLCEWVEHYWWTYKTEFTLPAALQGRHIRLHLAGVDYEARIALNGAECGRHTGMYAPCKLDVTDRVRFHEPNVVTVLFACPPREMGQIGRTSLTHTQKARFCYKWDFSTRLVQVGLYDTVTVEDFGRAALEYVKVDASLQNGVGQITLTPEMTVFTAGDVTLRCRVSQNGRPVAEAVQTVTLAPGLQTAAFTVAVPDPALWYPNGAGDQPVYDLTLTVEDEQGLSDRKDLTCGFRQIEYLPADGAPEGCLPYSVRVNGKRLYIKGVNMVPLDMMYGRVRPEDTERFLTLAKQANVNLIRVWGGGLIESEAFYNCCDRLGLMVWQEFIQSSSGIDNVPSQHPDFLRLLRQTAVHAVRTKQHHPCLAFWCGGNELEDADHVPATFEDANLRMLRQVVEQYDGKTLMLPTSATGLHEFLDVTRPGTNYDVHGPWKYGGPQQHYTTFNTSDSQLHSEFGVDGMGNEATLATVLSPERRVAQSMDDPVWRHHGEMWDTYDRDRAIFGPIDKERLSDFIACSQWIQAEGIRYAIEANRRRAFQNVGSIIWQFNEPWPNVAGTNVVDYYARPKQAYYALQAAFRPAYASLRYESLTFAPGEAADLQWFMTSDLPAGPWTVTARMTAEDGVVYETPARTVTVGDGLSVPVDQHTVTMPRQGWLRVTLAARQGDQTVENGYLLFVKNAQGYADRTPVLADARR